MKQLAIKTAVVSFFVLAAIGWLSGLSNFDCSLRALTGAIAVYVVMIVAGRLLVGVMVQTIVSNSGKDEAKDKTGGSANE